MGNRTMANPSQVADSSAVGNILPLHGSFLRHLHAENKAPSTRVTPATAIDQFADFLDRERHADRRGCDTREHVDHFLVGLQERGMRPATVSKRYRSIQQTSDDSPPTARSADHRWRP